jgi:integrase
VRNPADMADPPAASRSRVTTWTATELARFLEHVRDERLFALWRLAATTGMRRGELAGLSWRCLDLDAARLSIEQQLLPTRGGASFGPPKRPAHGGRSLSTLRRSTCCVRTARRTTLALTSGIPVHIVAARLGDDPKTVLGTYAHLLPQSDELAAERGAALIA